MKSVKRPVPMRVSRTQRDTEDVISVSPRPGVWMARTVCDWRMVPLFAACSGGARTVRIQSYLRIEAGAGASAISTSSHVRAPAYPCTVRAACAVRDDTPLGQTIAGSRSGHRLGVPDASTAGASSCCSRPLSRERCVAYFSHCTWGWPSLKSSPNGALECGCAIDRGVR